MSRPLSALVFSLTFALPALAQNLEEQRAKVEAALTRLPIEAHFDQPYAGNSNRKQMLDLFLPKQRKSDQPLPVVVFIHGGGWSHGDRIGSTGMILPAVTSGEFAGVTVSYRLSDEAKWPAQIHDCKAAIRWIRGHAQEHHLDPDRIAVWGGSAGGHLVSLLGTTGDVAELEGDLGEFKALSSRVTCVINYCGPEDFTRPLMSRDGKPVVEDPAVTGLLGTSLADHQDLARAASPITYITPDDAPFLTLHGTKDERVNFEQAELLHAALTRASVPSILLPIIDGGHSINHPDLPPRLRAFVQRHLQGQTVEVSSKPLQAVPTAR